MPKPLVLIVIARNAAWTVASIALLFSGAVTPNLLGEAFVAMQAIAVGALGELQYIGWRRSSDALAALRPRVAAPDQRPSRSTRFHGDFWLHGSSGLCGGRFLVGHFGLAMAVPVSAVQGLAVQLDAVRMAVQLSLFSFLSFSPLLWPSPPAFQPFSRPSVPPWLSGAAVPPAPRRASSCASFRRRRICSRSASDRP